MLYPGALVGYRRPRGTEAQAEAGRRMATSLPGSFQEIGRRAAAGPAHVRPAGLLQDDDCQSPRHRERAQLHRSQSGFYAVPYIVTKKRATVSSR